MDRIKDTACREIITAGSGTIISPRGPSSEATPDSWVARYGDKHRMSRVANWPLGIEPPKKVRVNWRSNHWVLQWWEPRARKNVAERVDGDLIAAIARAREIDRRLLEFKASGNVSQRTKHRELVERYLRDLDARADAGEIEPRSFTRYRSALIGHYLAFAELPENSRRWPFAMNADREFALGLARFLRARSVSPNGRGGTAGGHPMKSGGFVIDAVRSLYAWAADPDRGQLLGDGFRNPFLRKASQRGQSRDPFGEPDVTSAMAQLLFEACDDYQLRLFAPMTFYGLRASEPAYLFGEYVDDLWLRVPCNPEIGYTTKGKRDKRLPLLEPLRQLLGAPRPGLLFLRRSVAEGKERPPLLGSSLAQLEAEFQKRVRQSPGASAVDRQKVRDKVLKEAGATSYDRIEAEFQSLARRLDWPSTATLKDLRHLFATTMAAAGMPEPYRQYLMGHATTTAVIGIYTHLNRLREQYVLAVDREWRPLVERIERRTTGTATKAPDLNVSTSF